MFFFLNCPMPHLTELEFIILEANHKFFVNFIQY
jgi:hypothetical protein